MQVQKQVLVQTRNIAIGEAVLCAAMCGVFAILRRFSASVALGALYGGAWACLNFFLMGLTVQKAAASGDRAKRIMQASYTARSLALLLVAALGILLPCFHTVAALVPLLFPQITNFAMKALKLDRS